MGSEQNEQTSYQPSEPKLCVNNCGFFGNAATMNLCSKCYRDHRMKEEQAASAIAAMEKSLNPPQPTQSVPQSVLSTESLVTVGSSSSASSTTSLKFGTAGQGAQPKVSNRCLSCKKKVGLTGFVCKCGSTYCGVHRYPEKHDCTFDFKTLGREEIAKANPVVKADKVNRL